MGGIGGATLIADDNRLGCLCKTSGPNFIEMLNRPNAQADKNAEHFSAKQKMSRVPAGYFTCGIVFWLVTLFW